MFRGITVRLFHWPDRNGPTWVVAGLVREPEYIWYPIAATTSLETALDAVMAIAELKPSGPEGEKGE